MDSLTVRGPYWGNRHQEHFNHWRGQPIMNEPKKKSYIWKEKRRWICTSSRGGVYILHTFKLIYPDSRQYTDILSSLIIRFGTGFHKLMAMIMRIRNGTALIIFAMFLFICGIVALHWTSRIQIYHNGRDQYAPGVKRGMVRAGIRSVNRIYTMTSLHIVTSLYSWPSFRGTLWSSYSVLLLPPVFCFIRDPLQNLKKEP